MEKLADILDRSLKRLPLNSRLADYAVWTVWDDTVGPTIARNAQPQKIRNGTLFVKVSAPAWMQQLQYLKELIATKINERLGRTVITSIFFVVGTFRTETNSAKTDREPQTSGRSAEPSGLPEAELRSLRDTALEQSLRKLLTAHLRRRRAED